jgi:hypothetical protein
MTTGFTPIQQCLLAVLSDGGPHEPVELLDCLGDPESGVKNLWPHLTYLRRKLRPSGEDIVCEIYRRKMHYRHVRLLAAATQS